MGNRKKGNKIRGKLKTRERTQEQVQSGSNTHSFSHGVSTEARGLGLNVTQIFLNDLESSEQIGDSIFSTR